MSIQIRRLDDDIEKWALIYQTNGDFLEKLTPGNDDLR